jgi:glutathione S-transferase
VARTAVGASRRSTGFRAQQADSVYIGALRASRQALKPRWGYFRDVVRQLPRGRAPTEGELASAGLVLERIDRLIGADRFLAGGDITFADLYLAPQISNAREKAPELLASLQALNGWFARVSERPSFQLTHYDAASL